MRRLFTPFNIVLKIYLRKLFPNEERTEIQERSYIVIKNFLERIDDIGFIEHLTKKPIMKMLKRIPEQYHYTQIQLMWKMFNNGINDNW